MYTGGTASVTGLIQRLPLEPTDVARVLLGKLPAGTAAFTKSLVSALYGGVPPKIFSVIAAVSFSPTIKALGDRRSWVATEPTERTNDVVWPCASNTVTTVDPTLRNDAVKVPPLVATFAVDTLAMLELLTLRLYPGAPPINVNVNVSPTLPVAPLGRTFNVVPATAETVAAIERLVPVASNTLTLALPAVKPVKLKVPPATDTVSTAVLLLAAL